MRILPLHKSLQKYLRKHQLEKIFEKQISIFEENAKHPGLHTELLEPKRLRIYSFRLTNRYRAIFIFRKDKNAVEIIDINDHYQ